MIVLDLSRLLSRAGRATPTGIDRVELAYARYLAVGGRPHGYAARNAIGGIGLLPPRETEEFVCALGAMWRDGAPPHRRRWIAVRGRRLRFAALFGAGRLRDAMRRASLPSLYLVVSHQNLDRPQPIFRLKMTTGGRFACLIHDLIPLEFPEMTRPGQPLRHRRRVETVATLADAVVVNSVATRIALDATLDTAGRQIPIVVAPLGTEPPVAVAQRADEPPYFVCLGTIEARKNHRLLIDLWRRLAAELGDRAPRLSLIGRREFGSELTAQGITDLRSLVTEHPNLADAAVATLLRGARALLLPSFAEGFGLPVVEALTAGAPVVCSDLPALRESGSGVPEYLDPRDAAVWHQAVIDYLTDSPRRRAQLARLAHWRPPQWSDHFAIVERLIADLG